MGSCGAFLKPHKSFPAMATDSTLSVPEPLLSSSSSSSALTPTSPATSSSTSFSHQAPIYRILANSTVSCNILSYLTILELLFIQASCRQIHQFCNDALDRLTHLELSQFWYMLGQSNLDKFIALVQRATLATSLSLSYCHHLHDADIVSLVDALRNKAGVKKLNLFYVTHLTDAALEHVVASLPALVDLNLGRCQALTPLKALTSVERHCGRRLARLVLNGNLNWGSATAAAEVLATESIMPALRHLEIIDCSGFHQEMLEEIEAAHPAMHLIGPQRPLVNSRPKGNH